MKDKKTIVFVMAGAFALLSVLHIAMLEHDDPLERGKRAAKKTAHKAICAIERAAKDALHALED